MATSTETAEEKTHSFSDILFERLGSTAVVYYNRPEKRNAMRYKTVEELNHAFDMIGQDKLVRTVVVAAKGKTYCVGGDTGEFLTNTIEQTEKFQIETIELWRKMEQLRKPVIAAVNGYANIETIQAVDLVIAADDARFGLPETGIGISPGAGITIRLPKAVGKYLAKELLFTGEWITAEEGHRIGIVNKVVPKDSLLDETLKLCSIIEKKAPLAIGAAKACVNYGSEMSTESGMEYQLRENLALFHTKDLKEGITAFFKEKREPRFTGE